MQKRICPVCDQVMRSAHYCRNCRSWVKNPWIRDVTYYLNERHPEDETSCSYHGSAGEVMRTETVPTGGWTRTGGAAEKKAQPKRSAVPNQPRSQTRSNPQRMRQEAGPVREAQRSAPAGKYPGRPAADMFPARKKGSPGTAWGIVVVILFSLAVKSCGV
ncbi:MAG: hypothetical protein Q4C73_04225 [Eubacteriales bacterium]|nr:hypothetical protein [Eubacteriales bacterium]